MATLSNPTYFRDGEAQSTYMRLGVEYTDKIKSVVRYTLNLDSGETASHLNIMFNTDDDIHFGDYDAINNYTAGKLPLYFVIGTDETEYATAGVADAERANGLVTLTISSGTASGENLRFDASLEGDVVLVPGVTYYLWLFPGYEDSLWGYFHWYDVGGDDWEYVINLSGGAGLAYIDGMAYQCYIDNGSSWDLVIPYIDNGSSWEICN